VGGHCLILATFNLGEKDLVPIVQERVLAPGLLWFGAENIASTRIHSPHHQACGELLYLLQCPYVFHIQPAFKEQ
jgi:hypothetical protein